MPEISELSIVIVDTRDTSSSIVSLSSNDNLIQMRTKRKKKIIFKEMKIKRKRQNHLELR